MLAHFFLGYSAAFDFNDFRSADIEKEELCNKIAVEFLVPEDVFNIKWSNNPDAFTLAKHFKVSPIVIGSRALNSKKNKIEVFQFL